jgi:hypothetical protein
MFKNLFIFLLLNQFFFLIIYFFKRNFYPGKYVFLEFLNLYLICFILILTLSFFIKRYKSFFYLIISFVIVFLINYALLMTFIVNGDRSPSMYILNNINTNYPTTIDKVQNDMNNIFFNEKGQFKKRIDEQLHLNNIEISNGKVYITKKGKRIIKIFEIVNYFTNVENYQ